jgi:hypothetical protein
MAAALKHAILPLQLIIRWGRHNITCAFMVIRNKEPCFEFPRYWNCINRE